MITLNEARIGRFTSSEIVALTKGKDLDNEKAVTYIEETNMERNLGRSLDQESNARPLTWGKLTERRPFELLSTEYSLNSSDTLIHPHFPDSWAGTPDGFRHGSKRAVASIKCPYTLKSFCQLVRPIMMGLAGIDAVTHLRKFHKDGEKYYWQLVSDVCIADALHGVQHEAEFVFYMPYESELQDIQNYANDGQSKHYWVAFAEHGELPYIKDGGYYKNVNRIAFEIPQADKEFLTDRVRMATEKLIKKPSILLATAGEGCTLIEKA